MISHCSVERIEDGALCRVPSHVLYLTEDGKWEPVSQASMNKPWIKVRDGYRRDPVFPTCFDLHPTIGEFVKFRLLELDWPKEQMSLVFRYYGNWCYGVGYSNEVFGEPMTLSEFYAEISRIVSQL